MVKMLDHGAGRGMHVVRMTERGRFLAVLCAGWREV
jgi:hypothetical protein